LEPIPAWPGLAGSSPQRAVTYPGLLYPRAKKCPVINKLIEIIKLVYSIIQPDEGSERFITLEHFVSTLQYLAGEERKSFIVVRRGRKLSKFKENTTIYSDAPDTSKGDYSELSVAQKVNDEYPVVILIHQDGSGEGWDGREFWWPILITPKNKPKTIFALKDPVGKLKKR